MKITQTNPNTGFQYRRKTEPTVVFKALPVPYTLPLMAGYMGGSLVGILLMDYLAKLAMMNRYYHEQIGVYRK